MAHKTLKQHLSPMAKSIGDFFIQRLTSAKVKRELPSRRHKVA
nr:MAG TPA: hypothetical protein [Caudoviricetes sp.]